MKKPKDKIEEALYELNELEDLLTERIADLHEVKGGMQARHAYVFYRRKVLEIINILTKNNEGS